ncbi:MAG TPA: Holliday junction branch migration DNA helicase RuvB [Candidatus Brocadiia bacterium]|nr:Holliday junction branch migration DNA helicase RuvB [Candidatus Brocadiia bacterium]
MTSSLLSGAPTPEDQKLDQALRPRNFDEFIGQGRVKENILIYIEAAKRRGEPLDHTLFSGPPGLGKTTLAILIADALGSKLKSTSGPAIERPGDLVGILTSLAQGDVLFIDELHRLGRVVEEYLYSAMEDFVIDITLEQGAYARSVRIPLPRFTLVGATTREGLLTSPFRARFGIVEKLELYPPEDLEHVIRNSAARLNVPIDEQGAKALAHCSRGTPRVANRLLRRVRDIAQVLGAGDVTLDSARQGLERLGVDANGLDPTDRRILQTILRAGGAPVGVKTIAVTIGEEEDTIEEVYEPYLIQRGYLEKTPRGRCATDLAIRHYGGPDMPGTRQKAIFGA